MSAVPEQFVAFFDDAATFPPGLAPVAQAVTDHVARRSTLLEGAVGPAVLSLADLPEAQRVAETIAAKSLPVAYAAKEALRVAQPEIQRSVSRGIVHKNTASRKISRLASRVKALGA